MTITSQDKNILISTPKAPSFSTVNLFHELLGIGTQTLGTDKGQICNCLSTLVVKA